MGAREDRFANVAATTLTLSAANTLTFQEMLTGISLGQGVGMLIDEIDYSMSRTSLLELVADSDNVDIALTASDDIPSISDMGDRRIIHNFSLHSIMVGAVVGLNHVKMPFVHQFFPPLIIAAPRVFLAGVTAGAAAASVFQIRFYFRYISLTPQQYLELAEAFVLTG